MQPSGASNLQHLSEFKPLSGASENSPDSLLGAGVALCQGQGFSQNSEVLSLSFRIAENILRALSGSLSPWNNCFLASAENCCSDFGVLMNFRGLRFSSMDIWFGLQAGTVILTIFGQKNIPGFGSCTVSKSSGTHYTLRESIWCNGE